MGYFFVENFLIVRERLCINVYLYIIYNKIREFGNSIVRLVNVVVGGSLYVFIIFMVVGDSRRGVLEEFFSIFFFSFV